MTAYTACTDSELFFFLKEGKEAAFAEIYNRYKFILQAHAVNKIRDREEAKDIIQEVFTYLWSKRDIIQITGANLSGYLYGAVRHAILNRITHQRVQEKYFDSIKAFSLTDEVVTDHLIREKQLKEFIENEIAQLPSKMREVFELSRKENLSHKEIAERLGLSEQTVSKQISNAIKILKVKLGFFIYITVVLNNLFIK